MFNKASATLYEILLIDLHEMEQEMQCRIDAGQVPLRLWLLLMVRHARLWFWANYRGGKTVTCPEWHLGSWRV
jgi:hypothetical protein